MAALSGCGDEVTQGGSGGTGGAGGGAGGSGGSGGGVGGSGGSGGIGGSGGSGGSGADCGGIAGIQCGADAYCDHAANQCGAADQLGTCKPRPQACDAVYKPACACDGKVYGNECEAQLNGFDVSNFGCPPPDPALFSCGPGFCAKGTEYCRRDVSDVGSLPDTFGCVPLPASCMAPATCDCLANEPCGVMCEALPSGDLKVTCPGG